VSDFTWREVIRDGFLLLFVAALFVAWTAR
jgi:hypothetical protein